MEDKKEGFGAKVWVTDLWCNTSKTGTKYVSGFLAGAKIVGFYGRKKEDGKEVLRLYVQEGSKPAPELEKQQAETPEIDPRKNYKDWR